MRRFSKEILDYQKPHNLIICVAEMHLLHLSPRYKMGMCAENETEEEKPAKKPRDTTLISASE